MDMTEDLEERKRVSEKEIGSGSGRERGREIT